MIFILGPTADSNNPWTWTWYFSEADGTASMNAIRDLWQVCSSSSTPCLPVQISVVCPSVLWLDTVVLGLGISLWSRTSLQASSTHCIFAAVVLEVDSSFTCFCCFLWLLNSHQLYMYYILLVTYWAAKRTQRLGGITVRMCLFLLIRAHWGHN